MSISIPIVYLFMRNAPRYIDIFFRKSPHLIFIGLSTTELLKSLQLLYICIKAKAFYLFRTHLFSSYYFFKEVYGTFFSLSRPTWQKTRLFFIYFFQKSLFIDRFVRLTVRLSPPTRLRLIGPRTFLLFFFFLGLYPIDSNRFERKSTKAKNRKCWI
jgi:hypothetical protein